MPVHLSGDLQLAYPSDWTDRSITAFAAPPGSWRVLPNFVVTRDSGGGARNAADYADRTLVELARRLQDFQLLRRGAVTLQQHTGIDMMFTWHSGEGLLQQRQVILLLPDDKVFSIVASALQSDFPAVEETFAKMFASLRFPAG
ncbi:DcrB-related protein [Teichococcus deserti]|uniref:DcrB-related protein n=1 Tax=Teichococcus deserti TaxID=1817963 RepID=UPI000975BD8A|nr:DcrB-related protein [Pseudoroseomonas deserti]